MASEKQLLWKNMNDDSLAVFVLNVGDGDAIIIRFPVKDGRTVVGVVDCYKAPKTTQALEDLGVDEIAFVCATHPHYDHNAGIKSLLSWAVKQRIPVREFWDSGFRHVSKTHYDIIRFLEQYQFEGDYPPISVIKPTSGYETVINLVRVLVLSPSIYLRNRYDTFGTNINNASIVLKLEYPPPDVAPAYLPKEDISDEELAQVVGLKRNAIILGADAQFDAWARITQEFPELLDTDNRLALIDAKKRTFRPLRCQVLKAPHHMSKHGLSLEVVECLHPRFTLSSCAAKSKHGFPHELSVMAVEDLHHDKTDPGLRFTGHRSKKLAGGSLAALFQGDGNKPRIYQLGDPVTTKAPLVSP